MSFEHVAKGLPWVSLFAHFINVSRADDPFEALVFAMVLQSALKQGAILIGEECNLEIWIADGEFCFCTQFVLAGAAGESVLELSAQTS